MRANGLDYLNFYIGRVYYNYIGMLERMLGELQLDEYIAPGMGSILFALFEQDNCIIRDLSIRVRLSPSTLTAMLGRMKRAGLIERHRDEKDGRALRITLTPLARSLKPRCRILLTRVEEALQGGMSDSESAALKKLLSKTIDNIRQSGLRS